MENNIQLFQYHANTVRTIMIDGKPWFVAKDVCDILEYTNSRKAISKLPESMKGVTNCYTLGGNQDLNIINEPGLYKLIFGSTMPGADAFTNWVASDVLPAIRQTGSYSITQAVINSDFLQQVTNQLREQEEKIKQLKTKAEFFDAVASSKSAIQIGDVAKILAIPGIGRNNLFQILREKKILMQDNVPYQEYIDRGYFRVIEQKYNTPEGETRISIKTLVYQSGIDFIRRIVAKTDNEMANNARRLISKALPSRGVATV